MVFWHYGVVKTVHRIAIHWLSGKEKYFGRRGQVKKLMSTLFFDMKEGMAIDILEEGDRAYI